MNLVWEIDYKQTAILNEKMDKTSDGQVVNDLSSNISYLLNPSQANCLTH